MNCCIMWPRHLHSAGYKVSLCEWGKLNSLCLQSWQMQNHCHMLIQQVCHDGSLFRRHMFCTRQVKQCDRGICSGQGQSMPGWHRHYSLLLQSRLVAVFEVLPNQSDHPSPWRTEPLIKPGPSTITTILRTKRCYDLAPQTDGRILVPITFAT